MRLIHFPNASLSPRTALGCAALAVSLAACSAPAGDAAFSAGSPDEPAVASSATTRHLYMDVHHLGAGNVTAAAVAEAHRKDLAVEGELGVDYQRYWVDEAQGTVYCLVEAPSAEAAAEVHRRAHGLVADEIVEMQCGILPDVARGGAKLFMDTHEAGPGAIEAADVAAAHRKDLAVEAKHGVRFLEYWFDEASGRIHCLVEAPNAEAVVAAHREAHGMVPDELHEVVRGE